MGNIHKKIPLRHTFRDTHLTLLLLTLIKEERDLGEKGTPPYSIWRSKQSDRPNTADHCSRKEIAEEVEGIVRGKGNANFLGLHVGSFQENSQVAKASWVAQRDVEIRCSGIVLNATTYGSLFRNFHEHRYIYICRKINSCEVGRTKVVSNQTANWDACGCAGSGAGAGPVWMVGMVATVAPPPTPAWMGCHAKVRVL